MEVTEIIEADNFLEYVTCTLVSHSDKRDDARKLVGNTRFYTRDLARHCKSAEALIDAEAPVPGECCIKTLLGGFCIVLTPVGCWVQWPWMTRVQ